MTISALYRGGNGGRLGCVCVGGESGGCHSEMLTEREEGDGL